MCNHSCFIIKRGFVSIKNEGLSTTSVDDIEYYWGRGHMIFSEAVAEDQYNVS